MTPLTPSPNMEALFDELSANARAISFVSNPKEVSEIMLTQIKQLRAENAALVKEREELKVEAFMHGAKAMSLATELEETRATLAERDRELAYIYRSVEKLKSEKCDPRNELANLHSILDELFARLEGQPK